MFQFLPEFVLIDEGRLNKKLVELVIEMQDILLQALQHLFTDIILVPLQLSLPDYVGKLVDEVLQVAGHLAVWEIGVGDVLADWGQVELAEVASSNGFDASDHVAYHVYYVRVLLLELSYDGLFHDLLMIHLWWL